MIFIYKKFNSNLKDVMDEWLMCQRAWMYLEPIFSSEDIIRQLPVESKRYQTMERIWRKIMKHAKDNPEVSFETFNNLPTLFEILKFRFKLKPYKAQNPKIF